MRIVVKLIGDEGELVLNDVKRWEWAACAYFVEVTGTGRRWRFRADRVEWVEVVKDGVEESGPSLSPKEEDWPSDYCTKHGYFSSCGPCSVPK